MEVSLSANDNHVTSDANSLPVTLTAETASHNFMSSSPSADNTVSCLSAVLTLGTAAPQLGTAAPQLVSVCFNKSASADPQV